MGKISIDKVSWELRRDVGPEEVAEIIQSKGGRLSVNAFQNPYWLSALSGGNISSYMCWYGQEKIIGIFNTVHTIKMGVSGLHIPPFSHIFAPTIETGISTKVYNKVIRELICLLNKENIVDLKMSWGHLNILPYYWQGFQCSVLMNYIIKGDYESYFSRLNENKRREYKKLAKLRDSGEIRIVEDVSEESLLKLYHETSSRSGFKAELITLSRIFRNRDNIPNKLFAIESEKYGILSIGFFPYDENAVYNIVNASVRVSDPVLKTVNLMLLIEGIRFALDQNKIFDFEGSMLPGVSDFYELMGGEQVPVFRLTKSKSFVFSFLRAIKQMSNDRK